MTRVYRILLVLVLDLTTVFIRIHYQQLLWQISSISKNYSYRVLLFWQEVVASVDLYLRSRSGIRLTICLSNAKGL